MTIATIRIFLVAAIGLACAAHAWEQVVKIGQIGPLAGPDHGVHLQE